MRLLRFYLRSEIAELHRNGVRLRIVGDRARLAPDIVQLIEAGEDRTAGNEGLTVMVALSYGGRQEIVDAAKRLASEAAQGRLDPAAIDEAAFAERLYAPDVPDPDLVIRTSGEKRISNFLLWQAAYAEFLFTDTLWPDFEKSDLEAAIDEYHRRERRFGATTAGAR